ATANVALRSASCPVAHIFSTRVIGMYCNFSGRDNDRPEIPDVSVPTHAASIWAGSTPASSKASYAASTIRSSALLSQCSPNFVQPIPMIATSPPIFFIRLFPSDVGQASGLSLEFGHFGRLCRRQCGESPTHRRAPGFMILGRLRRRGPSFQLVLLL